MNKVLIFLQNDINIDDIKFYLKEDKYKNLDIIISNNIEEIKNKDISDIIYIGSYERYNNNLDLNNIVLVNEAFNKEDRILSSFSLNYYLGEAAYDLNKSISIVNIFSDKKNDKELQKEMYDKYITLGIDKYSYEILFQANKLDKKASAILKLNAKKYDDVFEIVLQSLL